MKKLTSKYCSNDGDIGKKKGFKRKVGEPATAPWITAMEKKPAMETYQTAKNEIKTEMAYDNLKGSMLLFEARSGSLRTSCFRRKFADDDNTCVGCANSAEITGHILFGCHSINPEVNEDMLTLPEEMRLKDRKEKLNESAVENSKKCLEVPKQGS